MLKIEVTAVNARELREELADLASLLGGTAVDVPQTEETPTPPADAGKTEEETPGEPAAPPEKEDPAPDQTNSVDAMPSAVKLAEELSIDITQVPGTGKNGRITKGDVQKFASAQRPEPAQPEDPPAAPAGQTQDPPPAAAAAAGEEPTKEDAQAALHSVYERHGMEKCVALLREFGTKRLSDMYPTQYGEFIQKCKEATAG